MFDEVLKHPTKTVKLATLRKRFVSDTSLEALSLENDAQLVYYEQFNISLFSIGSTGEREKSALRYSSISLCPLRFQAQMA